MEIAPFAAILPFRFHREATEIVLFRPAAVEKAFA
jgi:hypothetical protein